MEAADGKKWSELFKEVEEPNRSLVGKSVEAAAAGLGAGEGSELRVGLQEMRGGDEVAYLGGEPFPPAGKGEGWAALSGRGAFPACARRSGKEHSAALDLTM